MPADKCDVNTHLICLWGMGVGRKAHPPEYHFAKRGVDVDPLPGIRAPGMCSGGIRFERWGISGARAISTLSSLSSQAPVNRPSSP